METTSISALAETPTFQFGGIASGLNTNAIVDALVNVAKQPITRLQAKKSDFTRQISILGDLNTKLGALRTSVKKLDTPTEFKAHAAVSSDKDAITATAGSAANEGIFAINVTALAQAERTYSDPLASKDTAGTAGSGTLTIQVGTATAVNVTVAATDTLEDVAANINSSAADVSAGIVYDGTSYRMVVTGTKTGAANSIAFTETAGLLLDLDDVANQAQAAGDATITMDGLTINSTTNQFTEAIPGVTLEVKETTTSAININVKPDVEAIEKLIKDVVDKYNAVVKAVNGQSKLTTKGRTDNLSGDSSLRNTKTILQSILTSEVAAVTGTNTALSRIGVSTGRDGTLSIKSTTLQAALSADLKGVTELFTYTDNNAATDNDGVAVRLDRAIDSMTAATTGLITGRKAGIERNIRSIDDRIASLNRNVATYQKGLVKQFAALEQLIAGFNTQGQFLSGIASSTSLSSSSTRR